MEGNRQSLFYKQIFYPRTSTDTLVLMIHGITEGPEQFAPLVRETLHYGYAAYPLLLPGHGKTGTDFAQSNMRQWVQAVCTAVEEQGRSFRRILLVGHSLGALLSMHASLQYPDKIAGIFSIAAPFFIHLTLRGVVTALRVAFGSTRYQDPFTRAALATFSITESSPLVYLHWLPRYRELFCFCQKIRQILPILKVPVTFLFCGRDEYVDPRSILLVRNTKMRCKKYLLLLPGAGHFYYSPHQKKYMLSAFVQFLKNSQTIGENQ